MLTETDLATVRAALMFLDEEFFPDQEEMFQHYLDDEGVLAGASTDQIKATRAKFESAKLLPASTAEGITYQSGQESPVSVIVISS